MDFTNNKMNAIQSISTILKHDRKINTYKIALLRAINDTVLSYPDLRTFHQDVAIPLRMLSRYWLAYYWPFCDPLEPILQGQRAALDGALRNDMAFRGEITHFRQLWKTHVSQKKTQQDGFFAIDEMYRPRRRNTYMPELILAYDQAIRKISQAIRQPIQYAGPGNWTVFKRPSKYQDIKERCVAVPGTTSRDTCLVVKKELWAGFQEISLYVEALCLHEWCLFTERKNEETPYDRGYVFRLLTARPDNRRPLDWERNRVDVLLMENHEFVCPWTSKRIRKINEYDLDHIIPIAIYPINELWNLVPTDPYFNSHKKRDRLPSPEKLQDAHPHLTKTYQLYGYQKELSTALREDVRFRFMSVRASNGDFPEKVSNAVVYFVEQFGYSRNVAQF